MDLNYSLLSGGINYWAKGLNNNISTPIIVCHFILDTMDYN